MQMKQKTGLLDGRGSAVFSARESGVRAIPQTLNDALGCGADTIHERAPIGNRTAGGEPDFIMGAMPTAKSEAS